MQLQNMSMGSREGFKEYVLKWRDLAGKVQTPLNDQEMIDFIQFMQNKEKQLCEKSHWVPTLLSPLCLQASHHFAS